MRLNDMFSDDTQIVLSYGTDYAKDNLSKCIKCNSSKFNEIISCSINSNNELESSGLPLNYDGNNSKDPIEIAKNIWRMHIFHKLK